MWYHAHARAHTRPRAREAGRGTLTAMTNLPATGALPVPSRPLPPGDAYDFTDLPDTAIAYAIGVCAGNLRGAPGRAYALARELERRGLWEALLASLNPEQATGLTLLVTVDKVQYQRFMP